MYRYSAVVIEGVIKNLLFEIYIMEIWICCVLYLVKGSQLGDIFFPWLLTYFAFPLMQILWNKISNIFIDITISVSFQKDFWSENSTTEKLHLGVCVEVSWGLELSSFQYKPQNESLQTLLANLWSKELIPKVHFVQAVFLHSWVFLCRHGLLANVGSNGPPLIIVSPNICAESIQASSTSPTLHVTDIYLLQWQPHQLIKVIKSYNIYKCHRVLTFEMIEMSNFLW